MAIIEPIVYLNQVKAKPIHCSTKKRPRSTPNARFSSNPMDASNHIGPLMIHALFMTIEDINLANESITFVDGEI